MVWLPYPPLDFDYSINNKVTKTNKVQEMRSSAIGYITQSNDSKGLLYRYIDKQLGIISPPCNVVQLAQEQFFEIVSKNVLER